MDEASKAFLSLPQPQPAGGSEYYVAERERALEFSPKRRENFEKYQRWRDTGGPVDFLPVKLDIENVSRCNFRCVTCVVSDWDKGKRADDMSPDGFRRLIDEQHGLVEIKLQGIGEPLMQGNDMIKMIEYARSQCIWVRTTTNASLLHLKDRHAKLIDSDVNEVQISVDGTDKKTFESIRQGSVFERVTENCRMINSYARDKGVERTKMWTVIQKENAHQLSELVEFAVELGFTNQVFMLQPNSWGVESWGERISSLSVADDLDTGFLSGLVEKGRGLGVRVAFWLANEKYSTDKRENLCPWPFERSYVGSDLRVSPCCMIGNPDVCEIGSGMGDSFSDIWFSDEYESFRSAHLDGDIPKVCQNCYGGPDD